jgi:hypothetical protein
MLRADCAPDGGPVHTKRMKGEALLVRSDPATPRRTKLGVGLESSAPGSGLVFGWTVAVSVPSPHVGWSADVGSWMLRKHGSSRQRPACRVSVAGRKRSVPHGLCAPHVRALYLVAFVGKLPARRQPANTLGYATAHLNQPRSLQVLQSCAENECRHLLCPYHMIQCNALPPPSSRRGSQIREGSR